MSLALDRQPTKGPFFTAISLPAALGVWLLVHDLFRLDYASSSLVITICFSWFWQLAWAFGGWPANLVTDNRWLGGSLTLALTGVAYAVLVSSFGTADLAGVVFAEFALMWALVSFAGVRLFNAFESGYEEDPGGAGIGLGERFADLNFKNKERERQIGRTA